MPRSTQSAPRGPGATGEIQFKLLLPRELHQRIAGAAEERRISVSTEIRRRLEASFGVETDPDTLVLAEAIKLAAPPEWRTKPRSFAILRVAVDVLLRQLQPRDKVPGGSAAAANIDAEGAMMAGRALGALGLQPRVGEFPSSLDMQRSEP
jgi:hypothetical protein